MSLEEKLSAIREGAKKMIPAEHLAVMGQATEKLRGSGILRGVIKVGDALPPFELKNARGVAVTSQALLAKGPLVLTIFRGHW
jgi:hypothetical protein